MSQSEVSRFAHDLKSNPAWQAEARKHTAASFSESVRFAAGKGYDFTIEEAKDYLGRVANISDKELSAGSEEATCMCLAKGFCSAR